MKYRVDGSDEAGKPKRVERSSPWASIPMSAMKKLAQRRDQARRGPGERR